MPTLSMFYGIIIRMYADDRNTPHFHALHQGKAARFDFDGQMLEGDIPNKQQKLIQAWAVIHKEELEANWYLASNGETMFKVEPLR